MSAKSTFTLVLVLTREALLRLVRGETVETRGSPPGATMIEAQVKVSLGQEVSPSEKRAMGDALTQDVPGTYQGGFTVGTPFQDARPVVGTSAWLAMIASNADRILIRVQRGNEQDGKPRWVDCPLEQATEAEQAEALRAWLVSGTTPEWEMARLPVEQPNTIASSTLVQAARALGMQIIAENDEALRMRTIKFLEHTRVVANVVVPSTSFVGQDGKVTIEAFDGATIHTERYGKLVLAHATGDRLDACAEVLGVSRRLGDNDIVSGYAPAETDADLLARVRIAVEARMAARPPASGPVLPPPIPNPYARKPTGSHPMFASSMPEPVRDEARKLANLIDWVEEQCAIIKNPFDLARRERDLVDSVKRQLLMPTDPTDKQMQWLRDIAKRARVKAATVATQLPPTPAW